MIREGRDVLDFEPIRRYEGSEGQHFSVYGYHVRGDVEAASIPHHGCVYVNIVKVRVKRV